MRKSLAVAILAAFGASNVASGQSDDAATKFVIASVRVSPKSPTLFMRIVPPRAGRYELRNASMVNLLGIAYGFDPDKILGGPSWLEMDRFDVVAKLPPDATTENLKLMMQALLADRFKLVVHKETKPLPAFALTAGKKPLLKKAEGSERSGCRMLPGNAMGGGPRIMIGAGVAGPGNPTTVNLGPGMTIEYECRNITMAALGEAMHTMMGASVGPNPIADETGLTGEWNFNLRFSLNLNALAGSGSDDKITFAEAVEKQLGLKLEPKSVPTPVIVVDGVLRQPTENPPGLAEALPPLPVPTEFEVASVKPSDPATRGGRSQMQAGGRWTSEGTPLRSLITRAFNTTNVDQLTGLPAWADSERFDIVAKAPATAANITLFDADIMAPMIRALLVDRFKMTFHTEDRPVTVYNLVSAKPKMKAADPASRASCKNGNQPLGAPPATRVLTCQNITMDQLADRLQNLSSELRWPVSNLSEIKGGWDFTLTFSQGGAMAVPLGMGGGRGGDSGPPGATVADDPTGGYTVFQAIEKQLGLRLEPQKRPMPVIVIDHIEQKPTEN